MKIQIEIDPSQEGFFIGRTPEEINKFIFHVVELWSNECCLKLLQQMDDTP